MIVYGMDEIGVPGSRTLSVDPGGPGGSSGPPEARWANSAMMPTNTSRGSRVLNRFEVVAKFYLPGICEMLRSFHDRGGACQPAALACVKEELAPPAGFEPATIGLEVRCSVH